MEPEKYPSAGVGPSYMLCTPRATTSSTARVSWVKKGSPYRLRISEP